jgi:BASS family bile acid:Na+ symporter
MDQRRGASLDRWKRLAKNRNFILPLALALGLLWGDAAHWTKSMILPVLMLVMTVSAMNVTGQVFQSPRLLLRPALMGVVMSYGLLTPIMLGLSYLMIRDQDLHAGFVFLAAVPPAVGVVPFTSLLRGDRSLSLVGLIGAHLGALLLAPLTTLICLGPGLFSLTKLMTVMVELVVVPFVISRISLRLRWGSRAGSFEGPITNWSFFVVMYTIVGLNRDLLLSHPSSLLPVAIIAMATTFLLGLGIEKVGMSLRVPSGKRISLILLGTLKNYGVAGGMALALFSERSSVPATISVVLMFVYLIWLDVQTKGMR